MHMPKIAVIRPFQEIGLILSSTEMAQTLAEIKARKKSARFSICAPSTGVIEEVQSFPLLGAWHSQPARAEPNPWHSSRSLSYEAMNKPSPGWTGIVLHALITAHSAPHYLPPPSGHGGPERKSRRAAPGRLPGP
jgi:hypothetical protein